MTGADRPAPIQERLLRRMVINRSSNCWVWQGAVTKDGYGKIRMDGRTAEVHRAAYIAFVGPIPAGLTIDHVKARGCISRACFNPAHLEPVTQRENTLRGQGFALNLLKTHCPRGHAYTPENTRRNAKGHRWCRACSVIHSRNYRARQVTA